MPLSRDRLKDIWRECQTQTPEHRRQFVQHRCASDPELLREMLSLLDAEAASGDWLETPVLAKTPGRVGPFQIVRELGYGGMGVVFLAVRAQGEFEQRVALKMLRSDVNPQSVLRRFEQERRILSRLEHPSIARLIDGGEGAAGQPYLAMEYVDGQPIDAWCRDRQPSLHQKLKLIEQVCAAVHYAHQRLVVHRDIKPGNILVTADGAVKLLDFGVASLLEEPSGPITGLLMTPEYASPEQVTGAGVTTASDVYSLGVVLFQLVSGSLPYTPQTSGPLDIARAICEQVPPSPTGTDLDDVILKALDKDPAQRYESAAALAADLEHHRLGLPVLARRPTLRYRTAKFVRLYKWPVAASTAAFIAITALSVVALRQRAIARDLFRDSRALAGSLIWDVERTLREKTPTEARQILLARATAYLEGMRRGQSSDPSLAVDVAFGYRSLGEAQSVIGNSGGRDPAKAGASFAEGVALIDSYLSSYPKDPRAIRESAALHNSLGRLHLTQGRSDQAEREFLKARQDYEHARLNPAPGIAPWQDGYDLASVTLSLGDLAAVRGDWPKLEQLRRETVAIAAPLLSKYPKDDSLRHLVALAEKRLGAVLSYLGKHAEAADHYRQALGIDEEDYRRSPGPQRRLDLSFSLSEMGGVLANLKRPDEARPYFYRALALRREAFSADPSDSHARFALARLLVRTANFERNQSALLHAAQLLDEAEKIEPSPLFQAQLYYQKAFLEAYRHSPANAVLNARKGLAFLDQVEMAKALPAEHRPMRPELRQLISDGGRLKPSSTPPRSASNVKAAH